MMSHSWRRLCGIEPGGRLVEKQNFRIAHQRRRHCQTLALSSGELSHPGIGLFGQLQLLEDFF